MKALIEEHIEWDNKIFIFGDYDVDGTTSSAILYKALKKLNAQVEVVIGDRFIDEYGLSKGAIDRMDKKGAGCIITVDCGISNHEEIKYAKSKNIDVIVVDHHEPDNDRDGNKVLPKCEFVDLKAVQGAYEFTELCGAGIAWKVAQYITEEPLYYMLDLVAFATIADVVPLVGENRVMVKHGLQDINDNPNLGLKKLIEVNDFKDREITSGRVGYTLAPCINARGRIDNNQISFELLSSKDRGRVEEIATILKKENEKRKVMTKEAIADIQEKVDEDDNIIIAQNDIGKGIVGVVAGDIKEDFDKPSVVFGEPNKDGICKGSARSCKPLHIKEALDKVPDLLEGYGGHKFAAGLSIHIDNIDRFKKEMLEITEGIEYETTKYDMELDVSDISKSLVYDLEVFNPTGRSNPSPKFLVSGKARRIRPTKSGEHLMFTINGIDAIAFSMVDQYEKLKYNGEVIGSVDINEYRGNKTLQIKVSEIL